MIKIIRGKSFNEHITVETQTVTTVFQMTWTDYYRGYGALSNGSVIIAPIYFLPGIGENYGRYFNSIYMKDLYLSDITTDGILACENKFDITDTGLDEEVIVTYTWSTKSGSETKKPDEAASWKMAFTTSLDEIDGSVYIDVDGNRVSWPYRYFTEIDPSFYYPDVETGVEYIFSEASEDIKNWYVEEFISEVPEISIKRPKTILTLTAYSNGLRGSIIAGQLGTVNNSDFLGSAYYQKQVALSAKGKIPWIWQVDWLSYDDTGQWLFVDCEVEDIGSGFYEYKYIFEFNPDGWNNLVLPEKTVDLKIYRYMDFYNILLAGMDMSAPDIREER